MKKLFALLLVAAMLTAIFAGCSSTEAAPSTAESAAASEEVVAEAPAVEEPAPAEEEAPAEEASVIEEETPEEVIEELPSLSYPIADGDVTFNMLQIYNPNASAVYGNDKDYSSALTYQTLAEATGINIEFKMLAEATFSTQIDLIIASGDTPDFYGRSLGSYDSKLQAAVEEEVVIDYKPLLEENAPDLYNLMQRDPDWASQLENSDGSMCKLAGYTLPKTTDGPFIRGDWLEELGLDVPTDLESLTSTLEAFKSEYDCSLTLLLDSDLGSVLDQCFNMTAMGFNFFSFQLDAPNSGNVICGLCTEDYIQYLLTLNEYYEKGIINGDFLNTSKNLGNLESKYINGDSGVWKDDAKYTFNNAAAAREADPDWTPVAFNLDKTDYHLSRAATSGGVGMTQLYISANCEDPELAMQFVNYGYTGEGALLIQAGIEDTTFVYDENGKMSYTDLIINNPEGWTSSQATYVYLTDAWMPTIQLEEVFNMAYSDETLAAYDTWSNAYGGDDSMAIPMDCQLNAEEMSEVFTLMSDCLTIFSENAAKVILGDLDEAGYRDVIDMAMEQGLDRITEIYQGAYDRYMAA